MKVYLVQNYKCYDPALHGHDLTDALIRRLLATGGFLDPGQASQLRIQRLAGGKPVLPEYPGLHVSVSHTGDVFALAAGGQNMGLDIQGLAQVRQMRISQIAQRCFTEEEREWIFAEGGTDAIALASSASVDTARDGAAAGEGKSAAAQAARRFCQLWTRKEAWAKYTGEGLTAVMTREPVLDRRDLHFLEFALPAKGREAAAMPGAPAASCGNAGEETILGCLCTDRPVGLEIVTVDPVSIK